MAEKNPSGKEPTFRLLAHTQAEEDSYNITLHRANPKAMGMLASIVHIVKGALGGGILNGHVAWMTAGVWVAMPSCIIVGFTYSTVCMYMIDTMICIDLFGSCAAYQIIISKSIKQLVENTETTSIAGAEGMPGLRTYMAAMLIPIILICLIQHLKWLAPFSFAGNLVIMFCIAVAIYYAFDYNPKFENMVPRTTLIQFFEFIGMAAFSMSCAAVVIPIENNMSSPAKFPLCLAIGMAFVVLFVFLLSFFGYVAFLDKCEAPITVNFPLNVLGKTLKGCIAVMIFLTHALNFWVPFNTVYFYMKKRIDPKNHYRYEIILRAVFVILITIVAIIFPTITALMGFLGALCLTNLGFIYPHVIYLLIVWDRPGLGAFKWRLWRSCAMITFGILICVCSTTVNLVRLVTIAFNPTSAHR